jgi:hypothetical protein
VTDERKSARGYRWAPFQPGNPGGPGRPPTHGAYSEAEYEPLAEAIEAHLQSTSPAFADADLHARRRLANTLARCTLVDRLVAERGVLDGNGRLWPVIRDLERWENSARKYMRELGMTTLSRAELRLDELSFAEGAVRFEDVQAALQATLRLALEFVPAERRDEFVVRWRERLGHAEEGAGRELEQG